MTYREMTIIREEFYAAISRKTSWGKEELKIEFERALTNATIKIAEEKHGA